MVIFFLLEYWCLFLNLLSNTTGLLNSANQLSPHKKYMLKYLICKIRYRYKLFIDINFTWFATVIHKWSYDNIFNWIFWTYIYRFPALKEFPSQSLKLKRSLWRTKLRAVGRVGKILTQLLRRKPPKLGNHLQIPAQLMRRKPHRQRNQLQSQMAHQIITRLIQMLSHTRSYDQIKFEFTADYPPCKFESKLTTDYLPSVRI